MRKRPHHAVRLRELAVVPIGGMTNRMLAIASGRRICEAIDAELVIVWKWGRFEDYFEPIRGARIVADVDAVQPERVVLHHMIPSFHRRIDTSVRSFLVFSNCWFTANHEPLWNWADYWRHVMEIAPFLSRPSARLKERIDAFAARHLENAVGFHIRRTDHKVSIKFSTNDLFFAAAEKAVVAGMKIFLATDNVETERMFREAFPGRVVTFPKTGSRDIRWPRSFDPVAAEEDLIDFYLLAKTKRIVGSYGSTYTEAAVLLNGSPECMVPRAPDRTLKGRAFGVLRKMGPLGRLVADRRWFIDVRRARYFCRWIGVWADGIVEFLSGSGPQRWGQAWRHDTWGRPDGL